jgi:hypothetical protein
MHQNALKSLSVTALGFVLGARGVEWQTIPADGTKVVALSGTLADNFSEQGNSAANPNQGGAQGYNLCPAGSATVALTKSAENKDLYRFFSSIIATNGTAPTVTLDLSGLNGAPFQFHGNLHFKSDATLHIKGTNTFVMGSDQNWPSYYPTFNVPYKVEFDEDVTDGKVVFKNQICVYAKPPDLAHEIADNATVSMHNNVLGFGSSITLDRYDLALMDSSATGCAPVPQGTMITVPAGRILYLFPCTVNADWRWTRAGGIITNDIVLAGGKLGLQAATSSEFHLAGSITGTGDLFSAWTFSAWSTWNRVTGPVDFTGNIDLAYGSSKDVALELGGVLPGAHFGTVRLSGVQNKQTLLALKPSSSAPDHTLVPVMIDLLENPSGAAADKASVLTRRPLSLTVGNVAHNLSFTESGPVTLNALGSNVVVRHVGQVKAPGYVTLPTNGVYLTWGKAARTEFNLSDFALPDSVGRMIEVDDNMLSLYNPTSGCQVCVSESGTLNLGVGTGRMAVRSEGGTVNVTGRAGDWGSLPVLWIDPSAAGTVSNLVVHYENSYAAYDNEDNSARLKLGQTIRYTNDFPFVNGIFDCRGASASYKLWNDRYDNLYNGNHNTMHGTFPYLVTGGLNGKATLSFGKIGTAYNNVRHDYVDDTWKNVNFSNMSRIYVTLAGDIVGTKVLNPRYVVMVFGSQQGGGNALLAGRSTGELSRGGNTLDAPIFTNTAYEAWIDGSKVNPVDTSLLNGGWQVITLGLKGATVYGLGFDRNAAGDNGGQNYAEVLFFDEELTEMQRQAVEIYLAEKWGLASNYNYPAWVEDAVEAVPVYGTGTVNLKTDAALGGAFAGTVNLNGHALTVDGVALPPTDSDIDTDGCVGWYDPDCAGTFTTRDVPDKTPPTRLARLNDRLGTADGRRSLSGAAAPQRAPWINTALRGFGPSRNWLDFSDVAYNAGYFGNNLRFREMQNGQETGDVVTNAFRTIVMAMDSSRGGGQPFVDGANVAAAGVAYYAKRVDKKASDPIYPSGSDEILTQGRTYLDGNRVANPSATGFRGRPEILTVIPTNAYGMLCFDYFGNSENKSITNATSLILGESLLYNRELDDAERTRVEAYLAWKWLGLTREGYSILTNATVTGAGSVTAANVSLLPRFAADCTAALTLGSGDFAFTLAGDTVTGARDFGQCTLALPDSCAISVTCVGKAIIGDYLLISCGAFEGNPTFTLNDQGFGSARMSLIKDANTLKLHVVPAGMSIMLR